MTSSPAPEKEGALAEERRYLGVDPHRPGSAIADVILGGQDGIVNALSVLLGVAAASDNGRVVLAAGVATALAGAVSMAAVAYTSRAAEGARYESERAREYRHVTHAPTIERAEVRDLYASKGFRGELLERIVSTITQDRDVWVAVMMSEEHHLAPIERRARLRAAFVVGLSALVGSLVPLSPFPFLHPSQAATASMAVSALVLFGAGAYKARTTIGSPLRSGIELAGIGLFAALVSYAIGALFRIPPGVG
jgi:predicted membrane protein (TIGR00267 family)